jgi:hypothetical protein
MNRKTAAIIAISNLCLTLVFYLSTAWGENMVSPIAGIDQMIEKFEDDRPMTEEKKAELNLAESKFIESLNNGVIKVHREGWMMDANYCSSLDTISLAEKCFSDAIFSIEMGLFATHEEIAFMRLRVSHKGFAELFERTDMWEGILAVYEMLYSKIDPKSELSDIVQASTGLDSLENLYFFPPFKTQLKGREQIFLDANLKALKQYRQFVNNFDQYKGEARIPFYRSPTSVAKVALMLHERLNPQKYNEILPKLTALRFSRDQKIEDIERYLDHVIPAIEMGLSGK